MYQDRKYAWCFFANVLTIVALAFALGIPAVKSREVIFDSRTDDDDGGNGAGSGPASEDDGTLDVSEIAWILAVVAVVGASLSALWVRFLTQHAESLVRCTVFTSIVFLVIVAVVAAFFHPLAALPFALFAALGVCFWMSIRARVPFAAANLKTASLAIQRYPATVTAAFITLAVQIVWVCFWILAAAGVASKLHDSYEESKAAAPTNDPNNDPTTGTHSATDGEHAKQGGVAFVMVLSFYWSMQVFRNTLHCVVAGTVGTWWAVPSSEDPTWGSMKRALTTSFGSICMGSLIVAFIKTLRFMVEAARRNERRRGGNMVALCCLCFASCILRCIEDALEYLNEYAFCQVALYGKDFVTAGKDALAMFKHRGWTTILNDYIIDRTLMLGCVMVGSITAIIGALLARATVAVNVSGVDHTAVMVLVAIFAFIVGFLMCAIVSGVIESAVKTVFVCFAERPDALVHTHPQAFQELVAAWNAFHPEYIRSAGYNHQFGIPDGAR